MPWDSATGAVSTAAFLLAVGLLFSTLEALSRWRDFRPEGLFSWQILSLGRRPPRWLGGAVDLLLGFPGVLGLYALQLAAAVALLLQPWFPPLLAPALLVLTASQLTLRYRNRLGEEGSDQMNGIVLLPLALHALHPSSTAVLTAALVFIALQSCLAYGASGISKLVSPYWRSGEAVFLIANTASFGLRPLARLLRGRPVLCRLLSWSVIGMEILFPLTLILPAPWFWIFLAWGFLFHLYCAVTMGLNAFLWAFLASYPALLWARGQLSTL